MMLQQAMDSKLPFRRPSFKNYGGQVTWLQLRDQQIVFVNTGKAWTPLYEDLFANDWVIQEVKKELTLQQILTAINKASARSFTEYDFEKSLAHELGFDNAKTEK